MADRIFQDIIDQIENFYQEHNYELGWRFLTCSKSVLKNNPKIAFINLNPRGHKSPPDHPCASCEEGSPYLDESWGGNERGKDNLQIQIRKMFAKIRKKRNDLGSEREFIKSALSGYFVPFRSRSLNCLKPRKKEAFNFGKKIWPQILALVQPELFVCINVETAECLREIIKNVYPECPERKSHKLQTGWGDYTADIIEFGDNAQIKLLRLPHLSRFTLFTSEKCKEEVDNILTQFCCKT